MLVCLSRPSPGKVEAKRIFRQDSEIEPRETENEGSDKEGFSEIIKIR